MTTSPLQAAEAQEIGTVEFISPDQIKVRLDVDSPDAVALNAGPPRPFPRVHNYVLISLDNGYLVGQIEWLAAEKSVSRRRSSSRDANVIDLPFPERRMSVNPLGTLTQKRDSTDEFTFERGAESLPTIGSRVVLPTEEQLHAVIQSGGQQRIVIGTSRLAANAQVWVDPDKLFGRHLAVLGNTGSGKSCSVAGLVRWSLEAARVEADGTTNSRFIILDPNGEYSRAFAGSDSDLPSRVFRLAATEDEYSLTVPLWFWSSAEWSSFTHASARTQRPLLKRALRDVKSGRGGDDEAGTEVERRLRLRRYLSSTVLVVRRKMRSGEVRTESTKFGFQLRAVLRDLSAKVGSFEDVDLTAVTTAIEEALQESFNSFEENGEVVEYFRAFEEQPLESVVDSLEAALESLGGIIPPEGPDENTPIPFYGSDFADRLQMLAEQEGVSQYVDFLVSRLRSLLADAKIRQVVESDDDQSLEEWLSLYLGRPEGDEERLAIIDLSLVPSEAVHVITAVLARMVFEALQRYRKINGEVLPTVVVMEEAHTFAKRYGSGGETEDASEVCCQVFERIAREGRKFGLGLVLSSQRPSELSPTVLSQCNTFLLHRISNDRDQEKVHRLVPDNLRGLLRELPSLPTQHAVLLGWASDLPVLVRMRDLPIHNQPHSDDPDFWAVWVRKDAEGNSVPRKPDWVPVAEDWQRYAESSDSDA